MQADCPADSIFGGHLPKFVSVVYPQILSLAPRLVFWPVRHIAQCIPREVECCISTLAVANKYDVRVCRDDDVPDWLQDVLKDYPAPKDSSSYQQPGPASDLLDPVQAAGPPVREAKRPEPRRLNYEGHYRTPTEESILSDRPSHASEDRPLGHIEQSAQRQVRGHDRRKMLRFLTKNIVCVPLAQEGRTLSSHLAFSLLDLPVA